MPITIINNKIIGRTLKIKDDTGREKENTGRRIWNTDEWKYRNGGE